MNKHKVSAKNTNIFKFLYAFGSIIGALTLLFTSVYLGFIALLFGLIIIAWMVYSLRYVFVLKHVYIEDRGVSYSRHGSNYDFIKWESVENLNAVYFSWRGGDR